MTNVNTINLVKDFQYLLNSDKYITYKDYTRFLEKYQNLIKEDLTEDGLEILNNGYEKINVHNELYIKTKLEEEKEYFDNMFKDIDNSIILDEEQRKAILNEEEYSLIIAGAGAGKTTTMAAKVKYLIEKKHIPPSKIAVISYTNKATNELEDRIKYEFHLPVDIMTFHSLGIKMIRKLFDKPLIPLSEREQKEIIGRFVEEVLFNDKELLSDYIKTFNKYDCANSKMFSKGFVDNYSKFSTFKEYFLDYKKRKQEQNKNNLQNIIEYRTESYLKSSSPRTLKDEVVRSKAEAEIANFLFVHGIDYKYEEPYPEKVDEEKSYLPDFTIEVNGIPLYIEYFGLSSYYVNGTISRKEQEKYNDIRNKKRAFHKIKNNNYIELDYKKEQLGIQIDFLQDLKEQLELHHVELKKLSNEEIYDQILNNNTHAEFFHFIDFIINIINDLKSNIHRDDAKKIIANYIDNSDELLQKEMIHEANLFSKIFRYYERNVIPKNRIDFSDMIYYANKYMQSIPEKENILDYDYLIVDEYQDISIDRYKFARNISNLSNAKVTSVGDDWQTIFSFAGSRIDLFLKYSALFPGAKQLFINSTYRSSQQLINRAGNFIMKNPLQIKKSLISPKKRENPLKFCVYDSNQFQVVRAIIKKIYLNNPKDHILIISRKNKHIASLLQTEYFEEGVGTRIISKDYPDAIIDAMSIHSSKGLGADQVILLNVTSADFPCPDKETIWLSSIFKPRGFKENFPYAEDRRIFYVALTRTKNDIYLLVPKNKEDRSIFIDELI